MQEAPSNQSSSEATSCGVDSWGPVARGFTVTFADGHRGRVEEIRRTQTAVELLVATGPAALTVRVDATDVEAILPRSRHIVVGPFASDSADGGVETAGGIVRMPSRTSPRLARGEDVA